MEQLSQDMQENLQNFQLVFISTIKDQTKPIVNAISWIYASTSHTIRFAVDSRSMLLENLRQNSRVAMTIFYKNSVYTLYGDSKIIQELIDGVSLKLSMVEVTIDSIFETMFYGSKITVQPEYEKDYNKEAAEKLDKEVMNALKA